MTASDAISKMHEELPQSLIGQEHTVQVVQMVLGWLQLIKEQLPYISGMSDLFASELAIHACYLAGPEVKSLAEILQDRSDQSLDPQLKQRLLRLFERSVDRTVRNGVATVFRQNPLEHPATYSALVTEIFEDRYAGVTEWVTDWVRAYDYDARVTDVVSKYDFYRLAIPDLAEEFAESKRKAKRLEEEKAKQATPSAS